MLPLGYRRRRENGDSERRGEKITDMWIGRNREKNRRGREGGRRTLGHACLHKGMHRGHMVTK